jgi:hypothetical protein
MRFFDPATQQIEQNAQTTTPTDVWIPYNTRITSAVGDPNSVAAVNDTVSSNSINFATYLSYILGRGNTGNIVNTGTIYSTGTSTTASSVIAPGIEMLLGAKIGTNMNVTTDQLIPITRIGTKKYRITRIVVTNASISLTTAAGGVYQAASKAGTAIVANSQVYSSLTAATTELSLTLAISRTYTLDNLYFSLTTAQGAAATADIYVYGVIIP